MSYLGSGSLSYGATSEAIVVPTGTTLLHVVTHQLSATATNQVTLAGKPLRVRASRNGIYFGAQSSRTHYILNPPSGSQTMTVTTPVSVTSWIAYSGTDPIEPYVGVSDQTSFDQATGATPFSRTVTSKVGETVLMTLAGTFDSGTSPDLVSGAASTLYRGSTNWFNYSTGFFEEPGATSVTLDVATSGSPTFWTEASFVDRLNMVPHLARTELLGAQSTGAYGTGTYAPPAFTPPNNSLLVVAVGIQENGGSTDPTDDLTITDSAGLTWTRAAWQADPAPWSFSLVLYTAPVWTGVSTTLTFDCAARSIYAYMVHVVAYTGYNSTVPIGAILTRREASIVDGALSLSMPRAPASTSRVLAVVLKGIVSGVCTSTPGVGWSELYESGISGFLYMQSQERYGDSTTATVDWADINDGAGTIGSSNIVALEIRAPDYAPNYALNGTAYLKCGTPAYLNNLSSFTVIALRRGGATFVGSDVLVGKTDGSTGWAMRMESGLCFVRSYSGSTLFYVASDPVLNVPGTFYWEIAAVDDQAASGQKVALYNSQPFNGSGFVASGLSSSTDSVGTIVSDATFDLTVGGSPVWTYNGAVAFAGILAGKKTAAECNAIIANLAGQPWLFAGRATAPGIMEDVSAYGQPIVATGNLLTESVPDYWTEFRTTQDMLEVQLESPLIQTPIFTVSDLFDGTANPLGGNWTTAAGGASAIRKLAGVARGSVAGVDCIAYWNANSFGDDQFSEIVIASGATNPDAAAAVRIQASNGWCYFYNPNTGFPYLQAGFANNFTTVVAVNITVGAGDVVRLEVRRVPGGSRLTVLKNGIPLPNATNGALYWIDATSQVQSGGAPGVVLYSDDPANIIDAWRGGTLGPANVDLIIRHRYV